MISGTVAAMNFFAPLSPFWRPPGRSPSSCSWPHTSVLHHGFAVQVNVEARVLPGQNQVVTVVQPVHSISLERGWRRGDTQRVPIDDVYGEGMLYI
jgi:hypothetical protein